MALGDKTLNRAQLKCSSSRPGSSYTTTADRFWELKMFTFRSSCILHLNFSRFFYFENAVNFSMDPTAKSLVQTSCKTSLSREIFLRFEHMSEQLTLF